MTELHKTVRVTLMFTDPNAFAFFLTISVLFTFIRYYLGALDLQKLFFGAAIIVIMLTLAATFSRKSWLAIFLALGIVGLRFPRVLVEGALAAVGGVLVLFVSDTANFSEALWQRFMTLFIDPNVSISERVVAWEVGMQLFHRSPLIGNGVGSFWTLSWRLGSPLLFPHSFYVYLLAEVGLVGLSLVIILAVHFAWALWTAMARLTEPYTNFLATLLFAGWLSILFQAAFRTIGLTDTLFWGSLGQAASFVRLTAAEGRAALPGRPEEDEPVKAPVVPAVRVA